MKVGRNDPCPCGSGMRYKRCCLGKPPVKSRKKLYFTVAAIVALTIVVGVIMAVFLTPSKALLAPGVGLILVVVVFINHNPPDSKGRAGSDRINFGR